MNTSPSIPGLGPARPAAEEGAAQERGPLARLLLAAGDRPAWARPALLLLLAATAVLHLWDLAASGDANGFYAAAVLAGTESWKAFFFGSLDAANFITVDKPPASLWVVELSARIFGFSSWSLLAPEALEGVAAVWILHAAVRRRAGDGAALIAGAVLALTPVAVLMFRFDNPHALLTLLLAIGAACTLRAIERGSLGWLLLGGAAIGFGFLTKSLEAFLILPALIAVYAWAAPLPLPRRVLQLAAAAGALVAASGWWVLIVQLWPASARPYVGGSTDDSELHLALGYNGLGRIVGQGIGGGNSLFGGTPGLTRLFGESMGTQISWLLPAALIALVAGLWMTRRSPRTDLTRAALLLFGSWLVVTGIVFSFMSGIIHPYYTVRSGSGSLRTRGEGSPGGGGLPERGAFPGWRGSGEGGGAVPEGSARNGAGAGAGTANAALNSALKRTTTTWAAATVGSQSAASLELGTGGKSVMAIGGFSGSDPAPTLAQFERDVAEGRISYFIGGGHGGPGRGSGSGSQITSWVEAHFARTTIGGETVYVLTSRTS